MEGVFDHGVFVATLRAKGAEKCPACGDVDTAIPLAPTFIPIPGVRPIGSSDPSPPEGIEAICVTCMNCGLIRMHDHGQLMQD